MDLFRLIAVAASLAAACETASAETVTGSLRDVDGGATAGGYMGLGAGLAPSLAVYSELPRARPAPVKRLAGRSTARRSRTAAANDGNPSDLSTRAVDNSGQNAIDVLTAGGQADVFFGQ